MKERKNFEHFGVMLDCSRNAVMKVDAVKRFIECLEKMGYNSLELYMEDTYEIESEPYFGYLRGRYTGAELKEIDAYAKAHGVELIPCVQTLGHFTALVKNDRFREIVDNNDILLVDEEKTYELIDKIFATLAENFTSRRVNIGMDETNTLGLGNFLKKHGYENRFSIFLRHLQKVAAIADKYGFKPHIWSDMFFRFPTHGVYHVKEEFVLPKEMLQTLPENVELLYWDYDHYQKSEYDVMFKHHAQFNRKIWFASGAWSWTGFSPLNKSSIEKSKPAMESVAANGISNVLMTMWGDDGSECSYFAMLPTLFAARQYADGNFDDEDIKRKFYALFGVPFDDFVALDLPDMEYAKQRGASKVCLYNDPFLGIYDENIRKMGKNPYVAWAQKLRKLQTGAGAYAYIFESQAKLCEVLSKKLDFGINVRDAYRAKDKKRLKTCIKELGVIEKELHAFHKAFYTLWSKENKPQGWEIHDARMGGLIQRVKTCKKRLKAYLSGETERIEELEEKILDYTGSIRYSYIVSRNLT